MAWRGSRSFFSSAEQRDTRAVQLDASFEERLQDFEPGVTLPYWNWVTSRDIPEELEKQVFGWMHVARAVFHNGDLYAPHYETVRVRKDGTPLSVSLSLSPIRDVTGHVVGASSIARDIGAPPVVPRWIRITGHVAITRSACVPDRCDMGRAARPGSAVWGCLRVQPRSPARPEPMVVINQTLWRQMLGYGLAVVLGITLAVLWVSKEVERTRRFREFDAPRSAGTIIHASFHGPSSMRSRHTTQPNRNATISLSSLSARSSAASLPRNGRWPTIMRSPADCSIACFTGATGSFGARPLCCSIPWLAETAPARIWAVCWARGLPLCQMVSSFKPSGRRNCARG